MTSRRSSSLCGATIIVCLSVLVTWSALASTIALWLSGHVRVICGIYESYSPSRTAIINCRYIYAVEDSLIYLSTRKFGQIMYSVTSLNILYFYSSQLYMCCMRRSVTRTHYSTGWRLPLYSYLPVDRLD